jgi:prepilin-type N-terminal cleavage/methylation domain-containing protein
MAHTRRGFTLVELMVAMVASMFVAIAVFTLAKHASAFAMRQSRIADATLQTVIGFERLKADIARAGFLSTPNIVRDPNICRNVQDAAYPLQLQSLASVFIQPVPSTQLSTESTVNGITPNQILLTGSYDSPDLFVARTITQDTRPVVYLSRTSLGMANINYTPATGADALGRVFRAGRALRIVDDAGGVQFGTIASVAGGNDPSITLAATPALQFRGGSGQKCGVRGHGNDFVNAVNFVRYDVRDLSGVAQFSGMFPANRGPTYEATRRELVREELDTGGVPIAGTLELVAEYVVDLGFSLLVSPSAGAQLTRVAPANLSNFAGDPNSTGLNRGPQMIRAVHAWLSLRSQEADRSTSLSLPALGIGPNRLRISLDPTSSALPPFVRVRSLQSTIPLNNQMRATWQ